jgi:hypothetical protein
LDTLHLAPPPISTSPDPMIETAAVSLAWAATLPDPAIDTSAVLAASPPARMSPEPAIDRSTASALPAASIPPDPAMLSLILPPATEGQRGHPTPQPRRQSPATLSTLTRQIRRSPRQQRRGVDGEHRLAVMPVEVDAARFFGGSWRPSSTTTSVSSAGWSRLWR